MLRQYPQSGPGVPQRLNSEKMIYRKTPNLVMCGLKTHAQQRGIGQWWMVLTIGIMVGFIFGFILFLSRLPNDSYTLVETERGIEQIEESDENFAFYDRLSDSTSLVPNAEADELPAFSTRSASEGKYGADVNERPGAVKIADELSVGATVVPIEIAAASGAAINPPVGAAVAGAALANSTPRATVVKREDTGASSTFYYLQAGAFIQAEDANRLQRKLLQSGMDAFINDIAIEGKRWHRVRLGPFYDSDSLYSAQSQLGRNGISYLVVKVDKG